MTRFCHWPLLTIMFAFVAGCGPGNTRGDAQELLTQDGDTPGRRVRTAEA